MSSHYSGERVSVTFVNGFMLPWRGMRPFHYRNCQAMGIKVSGNSPSQLVILEPKQTATPLLDRILQLHG